MSKIRNVIIVLARCGRQRQSFFGIRVEEHRRHQWVAEGAFAMDERSASRQREEGQATVGGIAVGATYPGCPHCGARNFARCLCGRMSCWDGRSPTIQCPWCQQRVPLSGPITSVSIWE